MGRRAGAGRLRLTKHEGAGNDFLVLVDGDDAVHLTEAQVRVLCDRHRGVGADGFIRVRPGTDADVVMELVNADGSRAEMSGNGIRCLAQAAVAAGLVVPPHFTVATDAGLRTVELRPGEGPGEAWAGVGMGAPVLGEEVPSPLPGTRGRRVDVGNPHLVLLGSGASEAQVAVVGPRIERAHAGGVNVEFVVPGDRPDELVLRVWERGAGETRACGTGSVAAAAAARAWGLVGDRVLVHNPGGPLEVLLGPDGSEATLSGPVRRVADVEVDVAVLR